MGMRGGAMTEEVEADLEKEKGRLSRDTSIWQDMTKLAE